MDQTPQDVRCGQCGRPLNEPMNLALQDRKPCPSCGAKTRAFSVKLSDTVTAHTNVKMKHKDATGKELAESVSGDDLHRNTGKWMEKSRTIDHKNDWYEEIVTDPETGRIVHRCAEPLSRHQGHGSDKKNSRKRKA